MIKTIVFDIGGVLVDWNPRYLYRDIFDTEEEMEFFLGNICTKDWNHTLDLGRPWEEAALELVTKHPEYKEHIYMYWDRWLEMFSGPIHETVDILMDLKKRGLRVLALSNWNDEKFEVALKEFPFLRLFDGRIVSGEVKLAKPDPEIYKLLLTTFDLNPRETFFVDDVMKNVEAARAQGIEAVQFTTPKALEDALTAYGVYPELDESEDDGAQSGCGGSCTCHSR
ncbi:MAG: HAD family phosphatase [Alphaproteobacteria bacterium]|nr:HAD family phosphatase [Alphaproteobacteria bacterium]